MATAEETAIAAIDAAEAMAVANAQMIKSMRALFPTKFRGLVGLAPDLFERQVGATASAQRGVVKQVAKKKRKVTKYNRTFGRMLKQVKQTSRLKDGTYRKGWSSSKEMSKAHKLTRKMMK